MAGIQRLRVAQGGVIRAVDQFPNGIEPERRKSFPDFLNQIRGADARSPEGMQYECRKTLEKSYGSGYVEKDAGSDELRYVKKAAMSVLSGTTGGYLLPMDYSAALLETVAEECFIYPRATVIPMFSLELQAPRIDVETAPTARGDSALFGGVRFRWGLEDAPTQIAEPAFRMGNFKAWDLLGDAVVSNQWLHDAGAIQPTEGALRPEADPLLKAEHYLIRLFGKAAAWYAEYAFLQGMGSAMSMPLGIVNSPARYLAARAGANAIVIADVANMTARLLPRSWNSAVWACSPLALAQVQQIATYQVNTNPTDIDKVRPRPCGYLSSLPLFVTDKLPPLGNRGDLVLFDPSLYVIAQRMEVVVDVSPDVRFLNNQTVYRVWLRLDGKPQFSSTVTLPDLTTSVSPYVVLNA